MTTYIPPQNLEAEESVLGAMLLSPRAVEDAGERLAPSDFYRESHATIFKTIIDMANAGEPVDAITVADKLDKTQRLDAVGGTPRIAELAALVPAASNVSHYAKIVASEASRRHLILAGQRIVQTAQEGGEVSDLIASAEGHLSAATTLRHPATAVSLTADLPEYLEELRHAYSTGEYMSGAKTGFLDLDNTLLGLWPGQLVLCAARPSVGKSAFALNVAENFTDRGETALFVSLEMGKRELLIRSLSRASKIDGQRLQTGRIDESMANRLKEGIKVVEARHDRLLVEDNGAMTLPELRALATRLQRTANLKLLVVDYIQLMTGQGDTRNDQVGYISRGLKQLAQQLQIPVLALSQMSRSIETRSEKRPVLSDLRDSGSLEQDSDVVMFLHSDAAYDPAVEDQGDLEVIVAKNRKGPLGTCKLVFVRRYSSFNNLSLHPQPSHTQEAA